MPPMPLFTVAAHPKFPFPFLKTVLMPYFPARKRWFLGLPVVLLVVLVGPCVSEARTDCQKDGFRGPVHRVTQEEGYRKSGKWQKGTVVIKSYAQYDSSGNRLESGKALYRDDRIEHGSRTWSTYRHDPENRRLEAISYDEEGSVTGREITDYDSRGRIKESTSFDDLGVIVSRRVYVYDDFLNQSEMVSYRSYGAVESKTVKRYDLIGRPVESRVYHSDGALVSKTISTYDEDGTKEGFVFYDGDGTVQYREAYDFEYDSRGNWIRQRISKWEFGQGSREYLRIRTIEYEGPVVKTTKGAQSTQTEKPNGR
jgi:hypothetical protein